MRLETVKLYIRVDYDDDDELITLFLNAVLDGLAEQIPDFNKDKPTPRQQVLILASVKELYDSRENRAAKPEALRAAISTMLIKEICK